MPNIEKPRVFCFEPNREDAKDLIYRLRNLTELVLSTTVEESFRLIDRCYQPDQYPFRKALIAPGNYGHIKRAFEGEELIDELIRRGMSAKRIALYTSDFRLVGRAIDNRVRFVSKKGEEAEKFLGV